MNALFNACPFYQGPFNGGLIKEYRENGYGRGKYSNIEYNAAPWEGRTFAVTKGRAYRNQMNFMQIFLEFSESK